MLYRDSFSRQNVSIFNGEKFLSLVAVWSYKKDCDVEYLYKKWIFWGTIGRDSFLWCKQDTLFSFSEFFQGSFVYIELLYIIGFFATHYFATFSNSSKISRLSKQRIEKKGGEGGGAEIFC